VALSGEKKLATVNRSQPEAKFSTLGIVPDSLIFMTQVAWRLAMVAPAAIGRPQPTA